jgi:hypothetical protein
LATPDIPIPYNVELMESILPNVDNIKKMIFDMLAF